MKKKIISIFKWTGIVLLSLTVLFFAVRFIGQKINSITPKGGINESMYVDINGTKQWISIYGNDVNNPVLLYLHGGPGSATSEFDYVITRKWADIYTVVTWDQRSCGKSYTAEQDDIPLTKELLMTDGKEMTEFILDYMSKDKLTVLGHSWGSAYGANLVLDYPEYYSAFIGTGQLVDSYENEVRFREEALKWADNDEASLELVNALTPDKLTMEHYNARNQLMDKYGYSMMKDGADYSLAAAIIFNPYYSLKDWIDYFSRDMSVYFDFMLNNGLDSFSLTDRSDYEVPYININGDMDYQTNYKLAQEYFDTVDAPYKEMRIMKDATHGLLESRSEEFSVILHDVAENIG
ncbi:MAG: alpha/beta hydrolase [Oscillospiraceae bacterium]|nr:alpha/beta hydrolase [Oscillospiraceae bacterium]